MSTYLIDAPPSPYQKKISPPINTQNILEFFMKNVVQCWLPCCLFCPVIRKLVYIVSIFCNIKLLMCLIPIPHYYTITQIQKHFGRILNALCIKERVELFVRMIK